MTSIRFRCPAVSATSKEYSVSEEKSACSKCTLGSELWVIVVGKAVELTLLVLTLAHPERNRVKINERRDNWVIFFRYINHGMKSFFIGC